MNNYQLPIETLTLIGIIFGFPQLSLAQLTPDNTLGAETSTVTSGVEVQGETAELIEGGARRGSNLFHSFQEFNVSDLQRVYFSNPSAVENILTRVTGENVSHILGTLGVDGGANLFLLNPNGIILGEGASLEMNGSFTATNADAIQFGEQGAFRAVNPNVPPMLTINPSALLFNQLAAQSSIEQFGALAVSEGESLLLVGAQGGITVDGGSLSASGGYIGLAGLGDVGRVELLREGNQLRLDLREVRTRSQIRLTNGATATTSGGDNQGVDLYGGEIELSAESIINTILTEEGSTPAQAGAITLDATEGITLSGFSLLGAGSITTGDPNKITLRTDGNLAIIGSVLLTNVRSGAVGNVGEILLEADSISLTEGSQLIAGIFSGGEGEGRGQITFNAQDSITLDGSAIFADVEADAVGNANDILLSARDISIADSQLITSSLALGNAGKIEIQATGSVTITDDSLIRSNIGSSAGREAIGNVGIIAIAGNTITIKEGSQLEAGFFSGGEGEGGQIFLTAQDLISIDDSRFFADIPAGAVGTESQIEISGRSLSLTDSSLQTNSAGVGSGGDIHLQSEDGITLNQTVFITDLEAGGVGNSGKIGISGRSLSLTDSILQTSSNSTGNGGEINLQVEDAITINESSLFSDVEAQGVGNSGKIEVSGRSLLVQNSVLETRNEGIGTAGAIAVNTEEAVILEQGSSFSTIHLASDSNNAGAIEIVAASLTLKEDSALNSSNLSQGNAGAVTILTPNGKVSLLEESQIATNSINGVAGEIVIEARSLFLNDASEIDGFTTSGSAADVRIQTQEEVTLDGKSNINTFSGGIGSGGNLDIQTQHLSILQGSNLFAVVTDRGAAGNIRIKAAESVVVRGSSEDSPGIFSPSDIFVDTVGDGNAGNLIIDTKYLRIQDGARISTDTLEGNGVGGRITLQVSESIELSGMLPDASSTSQINANTNASGAGGAIEIKTDQLTLRDGARISSSTFSSGQGGSIEIKAGDIEVIGGQNTETFNPTSITTEGAGSGPAGNLNMTTNSLIIREGAVISASTFGEGRGGSITIQTSDSLIVSGQSTTGLSSLITTLALRSGDAGEIRIQTPQLSIEEGAQILASTLGLGDAGSIEIVNAETVAVRSSQISAESTTAARAGSIILNSNQLIIEDGGTVQVSNPENGPAGNIVINSENIRLDRATIDAETAESFPFPADSANILIENRDRLLLGNESNISASAFQTANGGNISINSRFIIASAAVTLQGNDISANAEQGDGGSITVTSEGIFGIQFREQPTPQNDFTVTSFFGGSSGEFILNDPDIDPSQGLLSVPQFPLDATSLIDRRCQVKESDQESSFVVIGRGGLPSSPDRPLFSNQFLPDFGTSDMALEPSSNLSSQEWRLNPIEKFSFNHTPIICNPVRP